MYLKFPVLYLRRKIVYNRIFMKQQILVKATEMFLTLGFKSITMDEIAAELGISKKTIYQHYKNKSDLVLDKLA